MTTIPAWIDGTLTPVDKLEVHRRGLRHPAISVFVMDGDRTLLQRRSTSKYHTPGLWANTCCTHPGWNETPSACAARRLREELGIVGLTLHRAGSVEYRADLGHGLTEHEVVDLFAAQASRALRLAPDPGEVSDTEWVSLPDLARRIEAAPDHYTPWLRIYLAQGWGHVAAAMAHVDA